MADVARRDRNNPALRPLTDILDKHHATLVNQFDAFASYVVEAEQEGPENFPLYKWTKAHLPELRDLGEHFPSPERFEELAFAWLEFTLVGEGRMLLMAGANAHGLHLFWLTTAGFEKSAFFPGDSFPEPKALVEIGRASCRERVSSKV